MISKSEMLELNMRRDYHLYS